MTDRRPMSPVTKIGLSIFFTLCVNRCSGNAVANSFDAILDSTAALAQKGATALTDMARSLSRGP